MRDEAETSELGRVRECANYYLLQNLFLRMVWYID